MSTKFRLASSYKPTGDQPRAIRSLVKGLQHGEKFQTLLGVTGSGKTFTMANVIEKIQKPTLVLAHNKTLAAQLANEFQEFFPDNAVNYFVSYYDYYQPESYLPASDTYIDKEAEINKEIERLRHAATTSLLSRKDVLIVASVSCIYGLGSPEIYNKARVRLTVGAAEPRETILRKLIRIQYHRNDIDPRRGTFRVRGDTLEVFPAHEEAAIRVSFFGDDIEKITKVNLLTGEVFENFDHYDIFPATHYLTPEENIKNIMGDIKRDLGERLGELRASGKELYAQRLEERTKYDLELLEAVGYCHGIENYSRYLDGRTAGEPPFTLIDYFPKDFLMIIDESHITIPQVRGMHAGDRSRKETLVNFGFRLPSALDNRPLNFHEFEQHLKQVVFTSATPEQYERDHSKGHITEQLIRPTFLLDPTIEIKPTEGQIQDLIREIRKRTAAKERVLVTTMTKRLAEELSMFLEEQDIKVQYLHADIPTLERLDILRDLRSGKYDVLVGINLLREGLDLPEVSLIAILDADREGYLRSATALIQVMGRAARHLHGHVIMYADTVTGSMQRAIAETKRRRITQEEYNQKHHVTPKSIIKAIREGSFVEKAREDEGKTRKERVKTLALLPKDELREVVRDLEEQMDLAAQNLEFERAAELRDEIAEIKRSIKVKQK